MRRRRRGGPVQRVRCPRVISRDRACATRPKHIDDEHQNAAGKNKRSNRSDQIQRAPSSLRQVGVNTTRHPVESELVHRKEHEVETDEHEPEIPTARSLAQHPSGPFWKPVIEGAKEWKY